MLRYRHSSDALVMRVVHDVFKCELCACVGDRAKFEIFRLVMCLNRELSVDMS